MDKHNTNIPPLRLTWQQLLCSAGSQAQRLKQSLLALLLVAILQGIALGLLLPLLQTLIPQANWGQALAYLIAITLLALLSLGLHWWALGFDYQGHMIESTHQLRTQLGEQLRLIPLAQLQDKRTGEIQANLLGSVDENLQYLITVANLISQALITPITVALITLYFDWRMGLLFMLTLALLLPLYRWYSTHYTGEMKALSDTEQQCSADILEYVQGLAVLRSSAYVGTQYQQLQQRLQQLEALQIKERKQGVKPNLILASSMELALLLVLIIGVYWVYQGSLSVALLAALVLILMRFFEQLTNLILFSKVIELMQVALNRIHDFLAIQPLAIATPNQQPQQFDVRFEQVSFGYTKQAVTLNNINVQFKQHSLNAIVGESGSGKTSLIRLLMRYADPQQGRILIGGVDIRHISNEQLNRLFSVVFQDVYLFDDSILNNIRLAKPTATEQEVEQVAKMANCHQFITALAQGYHTQVGEIGSQLSGGERQRISIARAILKDAPIVILDEATASLDSENQLAIQQAINRLVQHKTVIVITHRLSSISTADQILVINQGQIIEQGTHSSLLARQGAYCQMWQNQQQAKHWRI
ncbi:ABC transporter ATP-binding protein [Lonepinella koalarum]|uniref:ABC transporter ATP-binding protein n=1 Tax=Lonepinella koalarum TaxID=53417 RepID=UPI0011E3BF2D|nr:ABC transporter ATP-binding protein [Lonepinella koalarum]TYG34654.1 ABC transporter ATP-binding protein [Lonepinella koalarum]